MTEREIREICSTMRHCFIGTSFVYNDLRYVIYDATVTQDPDGNHTAIAHACQFDSDSIIQRHLPLHVPPIIFDPHDAIVAGGYIDRYAWCMNIRHKMIQKLLDPLVELHEHWQDFVGINT